MRLGGFLVFGFERGFRLIEDDFKSGFIGDGEIGKDLAIDLNIRGFDAFHEAAVGEAERAGGGVDALLPEHPEIAFPRLAVAIGPSFGLHHGILGVTEEFGTTTAEARCFIDDLLAASPAGGRISGAWHVSFLFQRAVRVGE